MRFIYKVTEYQPHLVSAVAVAYVGAQIVGRVLCTPVNNLAENDSPKCFIGSPYCQQPEEVTIPIAFVGTSTSGSTLSFVPQASGDSETLSFQLS
jgi:hypothetical protein